MDIQLPIENEDIKDALTETILESQEIWTAIRQAVDKLDLSFELTINLTLTKEWIKMEVDSVHDVIEVLWQLGFKEKDYLLIIKTCKELIEYDKQQKEWIKMDSLMVHDIVSCKLTENIKQPDCISQYTSRKFTFKKIDGTKFEITLFGDFEKGIEFELIKNEDDK